MATRGSYGQAVETYEELVGLRLLKTTTWERTQARGAQLREARRVAAEQAWAMPKRQEIMPGQTLVPAKKGVTMDGVLVYILGEEWKEVKVGCVFEYETRTEYSPRPKFPPGYVDHPISEVPWEYVVEQLTSSLNYWLCSTRPDGRPHVVPRWCVYLDGKIYYDGSSETRHARNIKINPHVAVYLEDGSKAIILEGTSAEAGKPASDLARRLADEYRRKYAEQGYAPESGQWDAGGLYVFTPRQCLAWTVFFENPTKFVFEEE